METGLAFADSHPMEVECGVRIGNPKPWGDGSNKADLLEKGFDAIWIYPLEALDLAWSAQFQRAISTRNSQMELAELQNRLDGSGKAVVLIGFGDMGGVLLDVVGRVTHSERDTAFCEHRQIVLHVADSGYCVG
jgi:hypothetical protein